MSVTTRRNVAHRISKAIDRRAAEDAAVSFGHASLVTTLASGKSLPAFNITLAR